VTHEDDLGRPFRCGACRGSGAMTLVTLAASPAVASPLFCGSGHASTVNRAIYKALQDAEYSAQSEGFYGVCTIVGEPLIEVLSNSPTGSQTFRASVNATCLP
jgi:hypothetical protein